MPTPDAIGWTVEFRNGLKWPLRPGDMLRAYDTDHHELGAVPASVLLDLLRHALLMANLSRALAEAIPLSGPRKLPGRREEIEDRAWRERQRAARRSRNGKE